METTGMMICKMSMPHKGETHFPPLASHLSDWFQQQQQQWLVQKVQATLPTNVLLTGGGEFDPLIS
jgi:hypothetical protein